MMVISTNVGTMQNTCKHCLSSSWSWDIYKVSRHFISK